MIACRPATPDDSAFILSGWSASYRMSRDISFLDMENYAGVMRPVIAKVLQRNGVSVVVAHSSVLCGFLCYEPGYVYYLYVSQPFRKQGIARTLLAMAGIDPGSRFGYAARTKASWECRSKIPNAKYDPYRARFPPSSEKSNERDQ